MLISIDVMDDDEDTGSKILVLQFTEGCLSMECPVGVDSLASIEVLREFIAVAKQSIVNNPVTFH